MEIRFDNALGSIRFRGAGAGGIRLLAVSGLGLVKKEVNVTSYLGQAGQELLSEKDLARTITLSCDLQSENVRRELSRIMKILYRAGTITLSAGKRRRMIACRCSEFDEPDYCGRNIAKFALQFTCDNPYFTDCEEQTASVLNREKLLYGSFTFPCMFSKRTSRMTLINSGDVEAEPVIMLYNTATKSALGEDYGIEIVNHTTGQSILIERATTNGEVITVDVPNRSITSSLSGDITHSLSQDSYLSNFIFAVGTNDIEAVNYNEGEEISVVFHWKNQYLEAVW